ncbi:MAG: hypothetical protein LBO09_06935 [Candidatus Peribacteria bacterium]|nr:hypothetical protein [Candidatus Peribacteria bacterium]
MFGKEEATGVLKNIVVKILVAGIAIQSSWFIIAAILDVSTIATSAIGAIPSQVLAGDPKIENAIENSLIAWKKDTTDKNYTKKLVITGFPNNDKANENAPIEMVKMDWVPINTSVSNKEMIDMIMPNAENLVGPLVFMGTSILDSVEPIPAIDFTQDSMAVIIRIILD